METSLLLFSGVGMADCATFPSYNLVIGCCVLLHRYSQFSGLVRFSRLAPVVS